MEERELMEKIKLIICGGEGINPNTIFYRTRQKEIKEARQMIAYFCRKYIKGPDGKEISFSSIGGFVGQDHASVMHSIETIDGWIGTDRKFREKMAFYDDKIVDMKGLYTLSVAVLLQNKIKADMERIKKEYFLLEDIVKKLTPNVIS